MKPEEQNIGGKSIRPRPESRVDAIDQDAADAQTRTDLDGSEQAPQGASSLEQMQWTAHALAGNSEIQGALSGEASGPWVDAVTGALAAETAGIEGQGEALGSNQAMLRAMRDANGVSPQAGLALKRLQTGGGRSLPGPVKSKMEAAFGHDFSHVRIHTDSAAKDASREVSAHAFAMGPDIYFGAGEFRPGSAEGDRLIAHELTHVVQADEGRLPSGGGVSKPTDAAEVEAYANESIILDRIASPDVDASDVQGELTTDVAGVGAEEGTAPTSQAPAVMRSEDVSPEGTHLGVDSSQEGAMDTFYDSLSEYVGFDIANDVLAIERDYREQIEGAEATFMEIKLPTLEAALLNTDHACHDVFDFIWNLPLNRDGEQETESDSESESEQAEQSEQTETEEGGVKASDEQLNELDRRLILADAHLGLTQCLSALLYGPDFAMMYGLGAKYQAMLADMQLFGAIGLRNQAVERAVERAEIARKKLVDEKHDQLGQTLLKALTVPAVAAAAASVVVSFGATAPLLIAGSGFVAGLGAGSLFDTPDMGSLFTGVKETARGSEGVASAYEAVADTHKAQETLSKTKLGFGVIKNALTALEIGAAGAELVDAYRLDLTEAFETIERWEAAWPEVEARYQNQMADAQRSHAQMKQILAMLPKVEAQMAEHQTVIDEYTI